MLKLEITIQATDKGIEIKTSEPEAESGVCESIRSALNSLASWIEADISYYRASNIRSKWEDIFEEGSVVPARNLRKMPEVK